MPIYEYECKACGHRLEKLQKISDDPLKDCPSCSKPELNKLVSAAAFRLKGGGWYETDFKSGSKKNVLHGADKGSSSSDSSSSDSGSDKSSSDSSDKKSGDSNSSNANAAAAS
jgi:putative FmdB family regulatory protein